MDEALTSSEIKPLVVQSTNEIFDNLNTHANPKQKKILTLLGKYLRKQFTLMSQPPLARLW